MRRLTTAAVGSAVFFVVAPGIVAGLVPWLISGWDVRWPISAFGVVVMALGSASVGSGDRGADPQLRPFRGRRSGYSVAGPSD